MEDVADLFSEIQLLGRMHHVNVVRVRYLLGIKDAYLLDFGACCVHLLGLRHGKRFR